MALVDPGTWAVLPESKSTDVLSRRWKRHSIPVAVSKRTLPMNLFHWPNYAPSHWWIPLDTLVSLSLCPMVSSILYCYVNVRFFKYFLHTFCLVRLCDNPLLVFVWKEAKIWTQGTPHAPLSHFCYITCPTSIVEEPALLCYGRHLQTHDHWLDAKNKKTHSDWISLCDPFYSVTGSFYYLWQVNNCLHVLATNVPKTFTFVLFVCFFFSVFVLGPLSITTLWFRVALSTWTSWCFLTRDPWLKRDWFVSSLVISFLGYFLSLWANNTKKHISFMFWMRAKNTSAKKLRFLSILPFSSLEAKQKPLISWFTG